jgi:hypothetical protein
MGLPLLAGVLAIVVVVFCLAMTVMWLRARSRHRYVQLQETTTRMEI